MYWWTRLGFLVIGLAGCTQQKNVQLKSFYNIDSLVTIQIENLKGSQLSKSVRIDGKEEQTRLTPDSAQWASELEIFSLVGQVNKAAFRDAYVVSDRRDTNSNLTVREIKAQRDVPVSVVRLYFLGTPRDLRRMEATLVEENALYKNTRQMTMELLRFNNRNVVTRYDVESVQKFIVGDSVRFVIAGSVEL
jgi:hypothetical protein